MESRTNSPVQDLLGQKTDVSSGSVTSASEPIHKTGILPSQDLERLIRVSKDIVALEPILDDQIQPASLDLRLGSVAYRVRASFLPGKQSTVVQKLEQFAMHKMD